MMRRMVVLLGLALIASVPSWAGNGNMLHGFGAVNSSMGGAGAGLWVDDPVGALMFNPALISQSDGNHVSFGSEFFKDGVGIVVTLPNGTKGTADPSNQLGILPAIGWTMQEKDSKFGFGFGLIAIAGFRTDNPEDAASIAFAQPPAGFGRIYTDHRVIKIPTAVSFQANDKLALGLAVNIYAGELAIAPLPYKVFDVVGDDDSNRFYAQGDGLDLSFAWSIQPAFFYEVSDLISVGGSLTTEQDFAEFRWNSTFAHPDSANYGKHRRLGFDLDGPMNVTMGVGITPGGKTKIAADVTWLKYDGLGGFGLPGGIVDRVIQPFGWHNVWAYKIGAVHQVNDKHTLRLGYNYGSSIMPKRNTITATGAPAFFKHHFSLGHTLQVNEFMRANMGFYYVPRSGATGPFLNLDGETVGSVKETNTLTSLQVGLSWAFGGSGS
jgi:long-subunit fatty acid transport protein